MCEFAVHTLDAPVTVAITEITSSVAMAEDDSAKIWSAASLNGVYRKEKIE